jgi:purine nucleosidase
VSVLLHVDTDLGTDPDDLCALVMLLGWPDVEVVGVTTCTDRTGMRGAYVEYCLDLLGRADVPVAVGAPGSLSHQTASDPVVDARYWPSDVAPRTRSRTDATELLSASVDAGAVVVAIGPYTNLALLERQRPGTLTGPRVVVMGGWVDPPSAGFPAWGPDRDYNVQWDVRAARELFDAAADLTLSTLPVSMKVPLTRRDLAALREMGAMGELVARQSEAHAQDSGKSSLGTAHDVLPDDLLNFHYDPLACAVAVGWPGAVVEERKVRTAMDGSVLRTVEDDEHGRPVHVVVDADGAAFTETWRSAVERACASGLGDSSSD